MFKSYKIIQYISVPFVTGPATRPVNAAAKEELPVETVQQGQFFRFFDFLK
jgi:hypothetical protein